MTRRIDHLDDPDAPAATCIVPSVNAAVTDAVGRLLLIRRTDNDNWALPGGAMDVGESIVEAAMRETLEETGVEIEIVGLVGIYTNPTHRIEYVSNGEVRQEFSVVFEGRAVGGTPRTSDETSAVEWIDVGHLDSLAIHPSMRLRIDHYLARGAVPYLG